MTVQVSKTATAIGKIALAAPILDPHAFRLADEEAAIIARARELGQSVFAGRAGTYDREAKFPTENYKDLHRAGLLGISIPKKHGGLGADYQTYALAAAEIGRYCGARPSRLRPSRCKARRNNRRDPTATQKSSCR